MELSKPRTHKLSRYTEDVQEDDNWFPTPEFVPEAWKFGAYFDYLGVEGEQGGVLLTADFRLAFKALELDCNGARSSTLQTRLLSLGGLSQGRGFPPGRIRI